MSGNTVNQENSAKQLLTVTLAAVSSLEKAEECDEASDRERDGMSRDHPSTADAPEKPDQSELVILGPEMPSSSSLSQCLSTESHTAASSRSARSTHSVRLSAKKLREIESLFAARSGHCIDDDKDNFVSTPAALISQVKHVNEDNRDVEAEQKPRYSLQQGYSTEQTLPALAQAQSLAENNSEIIISSWPLDSGEKQLREEFSKRYQRKTGMKPTVQACFHKQLPKPNSQSQNEKPSSQTDVSSSVATAAAAAAAAAVASSGQYLQTVHALESKVAGLISQLNSMKDSHATEMTVRQRQLQEQIDRHTQMRLEQLERLGEQQGRLETQIASVLLAKGSQGQATGEEGGAKKSVHLISRGIQNSPLEIDENTPPRLQAVSHHNKWKLLGKNGDSAAAPSGDTLYTPAYAAPIEPVVIDRQLAGGNISMSSADKRQDIRKPSPDEGSFTGEVSKTRKSTDNKQSERRVHVGHWQSSQDRIRRMEDVLEMMQNELVALRQGTSEWRQRLEDRKTANRPTWHSISPNRQLNEVEHVVEQCEISRRNLEHNIASVIRQQHRRFWNEETADGVADRLTGNNMEQVKRAVDENIAAVSAEIKAELAAHAVVPASNTKVAITRRQGASKVVSKKRSRGQPSIVPRETQKGSVQKLRGKKSSEQEAIAGRSVKNKTEFTVADVLDDNGRYRLQKSKTVSFARRNRTPCDVQANWTRERRPILVEQRIVRSRRSRNLVAFALCPPRRTALAGWDKAERGDTSESSEAFHPAKKNVFVQTTDEATDASDRVDTVLSTPSKKRPQLSKQVLSPIDIDSASFYSDSAPHLSRSSDSVKYDEQEKAQDEAAFAEEEQQFDNYLTVREVHTELPGIQRDKEQKFSELEHNEEDVDLAVECDELLTDFSLAQEISMYGETNQRLSSRSTGPTFPPVPQTNFVSHSSVDADRNETCDNTFEQRISEWIEQEVMAQVFSHIAPPGLDHHLAMQNYSPITSSSRGSMSSLEDTGASLVNGRIVQLFVEAGLDVDVELIEQVARGVISDMLRACLGHRSRVMPAVASNERDVSIHPGTDGTPVAFESGDELSTPIPTRSQSPVYAQVTVNTNVEEEITQVTPPSTPHEMEETSVEETFTEVSDVLKTSRNIDLQPYVCDVTEDEEVRTPVDSVTSQLSHSGHEEVSDNVVPTPGESGASQAQSVEYQAELELSRSVDMVVAETQTSQQELLAQESSERHSRHSLSGTSSSTTSPTSSLHSKSSEPVVATSSVTSTLSTDPEISEGEYLLALPQAPSDPVAANYDAPHISEGEFAASPGDIRYARGKATSGIMSQSLLCQLDVEGDVHSLMKAFQETSPVENVLSESSSASEPRRSKKSRRRVSREAASLLELVSRVGEPIQQQNARNYLKLQGRSGHDNDGDGGGSEEEQDISVGQVVSSTASHQQKGNVTGEMEPCSPEDLSYGEVVRRDVVRDVIALSIADRACSEGAAHSPGEIKRAVPTSETAPGTSSALSTAQVTLPLADCPSASASPDSLALAQAAFHEVQCTLATSPRSENEVQQVVPLHQTEFDETLGLGVSEGSTKQDVRSLRSLFSKPKRFQREGARETAYLPSVLQQTPRRLRLQQLRDVAVEPSGITEESDRPLQSSDLSHQVDINVPSGQGHPVDIDDDTYGDISSISGGDF